MKAPFHRRTWYSHAIDDAERNCLCITAGEAETQHLLKVLNPTPNYYLDTFDEHDICDPTMGLPSEPEVLAWVCAQPSHFPGPWRYHP